MTIEESHYPSIPNNRKQNALFGPKELNLEVFWDENQPEQFSPKEYYPSLLVNNEGSLDELPNYLDGTHISILDSPILGPINELFVQNCPKITFENNHFEQFTLPNANQLYPKPIINNCRRRRQRANISFTEFQYPKSPENVCEGVAEFQPKRFQDDLYTPSWLRGKGNYREGLCSICNPPVWFKMKQSAYWYFDKLLNNRYHMNFFHGICASTGKSYPFPAKYQEFLIGEEDIPSSDVDADLCGNTLSERITIKRSRLEGQCGRCNKWVNIGTRQLLHYSPNEMPNNPLSVHHLLWFKHCQKCFHKFMVK
jgi:hypothetical protein